MATDQIEEVRSALETTLREGAELQQERDALIVERDQWAQAARDADDARRKLVEHVEMLQSGGSQRRLDAVAKTPEVADLLREKAELLVQLDILKERLADSMEELEGARRELVSSLDARSELQREQDKNSDLMTSLREVEATRDKLEQENNCLQEEAKLLQNQLENANLVKKCSSERLEQMKRETDEMKTANDQLKRELEAQMKEIAFLCDTLTETSAQYEDSAQKLEQSDAERNKLLAEKHKDLERIEELSGKLTEVRLQNDKDAVEERRQLQSEREFDAQMLADRMKELQECKDEVNEVKARATKAINVLKASLQNALLQMKTLGDEFEVERAELQEKLYSLDKQHREATSELEHTRKELQSQLTKDGTDRLREKVTKLSQGLANTREQFAEQTQAYEKTKSELKSARKQLHDNADFKSLFEEANDTVERLTNRNREFIQENKDLRDKLQVMGTADNAAVKEAHDEATLALREQIQNLSTELKREKDLRLRLREQNDRMKKEQEKYEAEMTELTRELTEQLEDKTVELQGIGDVHVQQRKALKQSNKQDHEALKDVGNKYKQLLLDYEQREQDIEDLAQELQNQRDIAQSLQQNTEEETHHARAASDELFRTLLRIENFCSTYAFSEELGTTANQEGEGGDKPRWTVKELPEVAMNSVKSAIQNLEQKCANQADLIREELGAASAEMETSKIDIIERLKKSEELHQLALDELSLTKAENKTYREENSKIRMENLKLIDLSQGSEGLQGVNNKLQAELQEALNERDQLQTLLQQAKGSQSGEYASLLEANEMAQVALEKMQREVANAKKEAAAAIQQHEASQAVVEQLTDTLKETQKTVLSSEQSVNAAQKERDDANLARDRAVRDKLSSEKEADSIRDELLQTKTDFARLQAVCQDLDSLNAMVDDTQDELLRTKDQLNTVTSELHRLRAERDTEVDQLVNEEKVKMDDNYRRVQKEKEELRRKLSSEEDARKHSERELLRKEERLKSTISEAERDQERLQKKVDSLNKTTSDQQTQIDDLRSDLLMAQAAAAGSMEGDNSNMKEDLSRVRLNLNAAREEIQRLTSENENLHNQISRTRSGVENQGDSSHIAAAQGDLHQMSQRLSEVEEQLRVANLTLTTKDRQVNELRSQLDDAALGIEGNTSICERLQQENAQLVLELQAAKKELEEAKELLTLLVGPQVDHPSS
eukprot:TRINITY_DN27860_c0_g1_i1.p1 TRINITY_DN27860_c0_g1~~TRINITY_DN27860_c0_g1_i1.p1  ORF type:complete len:1242 (+),score=385.59 TRINITY_DN27860_c0_g1_i1:157-3726(+)